MGTIIGAGVFSLPFIFSKVGIFVGLFYLIALSVVSFGIHLMYADIIVRTNESHHRFPGYAKIYLGEKAEWLSSLIVITTLLLTLTVYLILSLSFAKLISPSFPDLLKILIFWALGSFAIFLSVRKAALFESITTLITILIVLIIFGFGFFGNFHKVNFLFPANFNFLFLPFGPILFSLLGETAIPALIVYFKKENLDIYKVKKVILWGSFMPALLYLFFVLGISGLSGKISEDAVSGLIGFVSPLFLILLGIFGFISLWDSYASIGTDIKKILEYDWGLPKFLIGLIIVFAPLILYFLGLQNFLELVSLIGGILFSLWSILIIVIWGKASRIETSEKIIGRINPLIIYGLIFILAGAIIYQIKSLL